MGKLKDNYNKIKPTPRQIKKKQKTKGNAIDMCSFLEKKWKNDVKFSCGHCLKIAYESELNDTKGYVTDEELIKSSNYKLHPK